MAGLGDTSGDIQPVSDHVKDILQMTRDSEMMQSYVRVGKADGSDDEDGGGSVGGVGGGLGGGVSAGVGGNDSDSDCVPGAVVGGVGSGDGPGDGRRGRKGRVADATGRRRRRHKANGGISGGGGSGTTIKFNELTEEFKLRKTGTGGGGILDSGFGGGWSRRHKRDSRSRLLEEVYTDKDRAAAVNLGTRDIKASLRMKRRQDRNRTLHIPSTAESPTLLALARHCVNDVNVALEFIDKVRWAHTSSPKITFIFLNYRQSENSNMFQITLNLIYLNV